MFLKLKVTNYNVISIWPTPILIFILHQKLNSNKLSFRMSPKGRKSTGSVWSSCEACGVVLSSKDLPLHCEQCPPDLMQWNCAFLKDDVMYSFIEVSDITDEPKINAHRKSQTVFLSQSAMQLCHLRIGEQVVLVLSNGSVVIRTVWPTAEKSITSITVPSSSLGINQRFMENKSRVKVTKLAQRATPAAKIILSTKEELENKDHNQVTVLCKHLYTGIILKLGSDLNIPFYGRNVLFNVKTITPIDMGGDENNVIQNLENLSIGEDHTKEKYFVACEETKWSIFKKVNDLSNDSVISDTITLKNVGGYKDIIKDLMSTITLALQKNTACLPSLGYLLYGPNGVGKTYIAQALANEMNVPVVKINSGELFSKFYGETEARLRDLFSEAKAQSPSILLLDNVDTLCPKRGGTEQERRVIAYLLTLLDSLKHCRVVVLATTSQVNLVDGALRRPGRLDCEVEIPIPSVTDRYEILCVCLCDYEIDAAEVQKLAAAAHGFVAADLACLVMKSRMRTVSRGDAEVTAEDLAWALTQIKPSAMREVLVQVPEVKWSDIGGMEDLKLKLRQAIEWPLRHPESFTRLGIKPPRGVLMYGPPGCSKTMIAKALATESNLNFLSIKGSELFSKWVGESEKAVQSLFKRARAVAPSIVFLDELDALGGERSGSSEGSNVQERVLAQLLTEMDGVEPLGNVNIVAATNRPDRIDKALLRPGRLDRLVYVPLPDLATRSCILRIQLDKMPVHSDVTVEELALNTEGYSGAEVVSVCHEAAMNALQDDLNASTVQKTHFTTALKSMKPRTPQSLIQLYEKYQKR